MMKNVGFRIRKKRFRSQLFMVLPVDFFCNLLELVIHNLREYVLQLFTMNCYPMQKKVNTSNDNADFTEFSELTGTGAKYFLGICSIERKFGDKFVCGTRRLPVCPVDDC